MRNPNRNIVILQWVVIAVLLAGAAAAVFMLTAKANDYQTQLDEQRGNLSSLREQLRQAKNPTPTPKPSLPEATGNGPTPSPTPTPANH